MVKFYVEPRKNLTARTYRTMLIICVASMLGLLSIVFLTINVSPVSALIKIFTSAFSSGYNFSEAIVKTTPIIFTGLAVACGLKMKLWNIGAEGQLYMGAFGAVWAAQTFSQLPAFLLIPLMIVFTVIAGGFWGFIPGVLKSWLNVNEILTSLMLNYVAISWMNYLIYGPWRDPGNPGFPITARLVANARLPQFFGTRLHGGFIIALATAFILWFLFEKTNWGYEIRATGESLGGAKYAGIRIDRNIIIVFLICGAVAGIAGMCEVSGLHYKLQPNNLSSNYGSLGIIVAWLSGAHPLGVVITALFAGILLTGAKGLQISMGVSSDMVQIIIGLLLTNILIFKFFKDYKLRIIFNEKKNKEVL